MYCSGWGFHTSWISLTEAALIWRSVRPLRLVRVRHQSDLAIGLASTNLASLPKEILKIIEDMVVMAVRHGILSIEPFYFELEDCCLDALGAILGWYPYQDAFTDYAIAHDFDLANDEEWQDALVGFRDTAVAQELDDTYLDIHFEGGSCNKLDKEYDFWLQLPRKEVDSAAGACELEELLNDVKTAIKEFLRDHGMQAVRYSEETVLDDKDRATLLFSSSAATHKAWNAVLRSRYMKMLWGTTAACDAVKSVKWMTFFEEDREDDGDDVDVKSDKKDDAEGTDEDNEDDEDDEVDKNREDEEDDEDGDVTDGKEYEDDNNRNDMDKDTDTDTDEEEDSDDGYELIAEESLGEVNRLCLSWKCFTANRTPNM